MVIKSLLFFRNAQRQNQVRRRTTSLEYKFTTRILFQRLIASTHILVYHPRKLLHVRRQRGKHQFRIGYPVAAQLVQTVFQALHRLIGLRKFGSYKHCPFRIWKSYFIIQAGIHIIAVLSAVIVIVTQILLASLEILIAVQAERLVWLGAGILSRHAQSYSVTPWQLIPRQSLLTTCECMYF